MNIRSYSSAMGMESSNAEEGKKMADPRIQAL
jgi:hypothetical protein